MSKILLENWKPVFGNTKKGGDIWASWKTRRRQRSASDKGKLKKNSRHDIVFLCVKKKERESKRTQKEPASAELPRATS